MGTNAEEGDVADKDEQTVTSLFFPLVVPDEAEVRNEHQDEHGDAVDFGFDRVEPESIGERQEEAGHQGGCAEHDGAHLLGNLLGKAVALEDGRKEFPSEEGRQVDRRGGAHHGNVVHALRDFTHEREQHDDRTGQEHEERRSRGVRIPSVLAQATNSPQSQKLTVGAIVIM